MRRGKQTATEADLKQLQDWCATVVGFIKANAGPQFKPIAVILELAISEEYEKASLRGLKQINDDLRAWAKGFSPKQQRELDELLHASVGRGLMEGQRLFERQVNAILKRGRIKSEDEARLLLERADEIYTDDEKKIEMKKINRLLAGYERSGSAH